LPLPSLVKIPEEVVAECHEARQVPGAAVGRQVAVTIRHLVRVSDLRGQPGIFVLVLRQFLLGLSSLRRGRGIGENFCCARCSQEGPRRHMIASCALSPTPFSRP